MKIQPENIILNKKNLKIGVGVILISGNEDTLIYAIEEVLIKYFKKKDFNNPQKFEGKNVDSSSNIDFGNSLFFKSSILVYKNPKEIDIDFLEKKENENLLIIITDNKIKNSSKLKKSFDNHKTFKSITCYKLSDVFKKKIIDDFINEKKFLVSKDGYWYLIQNLSSTYGLLKNELKKIVNYSKSGKELNISDLRLLISEYKNEGGFDALFFSSLKNKNEIINTTKDVILSASYAYILIQRIKFYIYLIIDIKKINDIDQHFPRYLFMYKDQFINIYKKTNKLKISNILSLIKKTELMLRKNNSLYFLLTQRFLLNVNNYLK